MQVPNWTVELPFQGSGCCHRYHYFLVMSAVSFPAAVLKVCSVEYQLHTWSNQFGNQLLL